MTEPLKTPDPMTHGPIVTQPEDLTPEQLSITPDLPTERTATELLQLLTMTAGQFDIEEAELVQVAGAIRKHGVIGLFQVLAVPGSAEVRGWATTWYAASVFGGELYLKDAVGGFAEELAKRDYDEQAEELDRD